MIGDQLDSISAHELRTDLARLLANFLSSVKLYQDSLKRHANGISLGVDTWSKIEAKITYEFDNSLHYRVMSALRYYAQHLALPVHGYSIGGVWDANREFYNFDLNRNLKEFTKRRIRYLEPPPASRR